MKKIVVLSDTHKNIKSIIKIAEIMDESDFVIHLGDHYDDMEMFSEMLGERLYRVHGNCDYGSLKEIILKVEGRKIFITHGDLYGVKRGIGLIVDKAKKEGCDVVLYGHTHSAEIREIDGITVINPGCMTSFAPRKSFCYIVINGEKITAVINDKI